MNKDDFTIEELRKFLLNKEQPVGFDEFILLMADYIGDKDIVKASEELVEELYIMFEIGRKYYRIKEIIESEEIKGLIK